MPSIYPFTAIVGQERMRRALVLNAVDPRIGGVLIRGERGTAKSTAARALAALLPSVKVVSDCRFGCDPDSPDHLVHRMPRTVGAGREPAGHHAPDSASSICPSPPPKTAWSARWTSKAPSKKANGISSRACWPPPTAACCISTKSTCSTTMWWTCSWTAAAMGMNIVEREGISFSHPARFILVGTMNPEEGDLRPQLLDRFRPFGRYPRHPRRARTGA